jgi:hypothetical protein
MARKWLTPLEQQICSMADARDKHLRWMEQNGQDDWREWHEMEAQKLREKIKTLQDELHNTPHQPKLFDIE